MQALTYLQRALLVHDLQALDALEWESCFNKVSRLQGTAEGGRLGGGGSRSSLDSLRLPCVVWPSAVHAGVALVLRDERHQRRVHCPQRASGGLLSNSVTWKCSEMCALSSAPIG